jgi:hypothetical protein
MADLETSLQRWILGLLVLIALVVAGLNYWYRVLPAKAARSASENQPTVNERLAAYRAGQGLKTTSDAAVTRSPSGVEATALSTGSAPITTEAAREQDLAIPLLTLPDGRSLGFARTVMPDDNTQDWPITDVIHPWVQRGDGTERAAHPRIPSRRAQFIPLLLADGRLALVGGQTPRDVIALEKRCADCPDEYQPFGDATPSLSTDVYDFASRTWSAGPRSEFTTDAAIRLRDGRVLKVNLHTAQGKSFKLATRISLEISDAKFTGWQRAGDLDAESHLTDLQLFESRTGAVLLFGGKDTQRAFHWQPRGSLKPWFQGETWSRVEKLDEGHLQISQALNEYPPRTRKKILELP